MFHISLSRLRKILPPFIEDRSDQMRFSTGQQIAGLKERKYLFFTSSGPVELAFRPPHMLAAAALTLAITAGGFGMSTLTSWPELRPSITAHLQSASEAISEPVRARIILLGGLLPQLSAQLSTKTPEASAKDRPSPLRTEAGKAHLSPSSETAGQTLIETEDSQQIDTVSDENAQPVIAAVALTRAESLDSLKDEVTPLTPAPPESLEMDPEFVGFDGLAFPPVRTETVRFHQQYVGMLAEIEAIKSIFGRFSIPMDEAPAQVAIRTTPHKAGLPELYLYRDSWRKTLALLPLKPPLRYYYITSPYGWRTNKKTGVRRFHHGVDLAGTWKSQLYSAADGIVSYAGREGGFGKVVRVQHSHGVETVYAHLSSITVSIGDYVTHDTVIGKMGNTGRSDGMHLHYEVRIQGKSIDPALMFKIGHQIGVLGDVPRTLSF